MHYFITLYSLLQGHFTILCFVKKNKLLTIQCNGIETHLIYANHRLQISLPHKDKLLKPAYSQALNQKENQKGSSRWVCSGLVPSPQVRQVMVFGIGTAVKMEKKNYDTILYILFSLFQYLHSN